MLQKENFNLNTLYNSYQNIQNDNEILNLSIDEKNSKINEMTVSNAILNETIESLENEKEFIVQSVNEIIGMINTNNIDSMMDSDNVKELISKHKMNIHILINIVQQYQNELNSIYIDKEKIIQDNVDLIKCNMKLKKQIELIRNQNLN